MAGYHSSSWGDTMHDSIDRPLEIIRWAYRLLYVLLFISLMVVMGYWHTIITFTFLASVLVPILLCFSSKKEFETRDDVHKCTLEYTSEQSGT